MRSGPGRSRRDSEELRDEANAYAAVSVACGQGACVRAEAIAGIRFLLEEAPQLPMLNCTAETCTCRYFHFRDRRSFLANRRSGTELEGLSFKSLVARDRRRGPNRRRLKLLEPDRQG